MHQQCWRYREELPGQYSEHLSDNVCFPTVGLLFQATCFIRRGNTMLESSSVSPSSHSSKSADDLMQDEKRQQSLFSAVSHGIYFLSILIILWSIKACNKSRCILPQADSTCKHFLHPHPHRSGPEAKHDYPILMRFLMWFFSLQSLQDNPTLTCVHAVVNVCSLL